MQTVPLPLDSDLAVKPIDVRIIEHPEYIDYEIEFVQLDQGTHVVYKATLAGEMSDGWYPYINLFLGHQRSLWVRTRMLYCKDKFLKLTSHRRKGLLGL